jgi:hypothetical protein
MIILQIDLDRIFAVPAEGQPPIARNGHGVAALFVCAKEHYGIAARGHYRHFGGMSVKFHNLPKECSCRGEGLVPVGNVPRVGTLPELVTYQCPACGHVETVEQQPSAPGPGQPR